MSSEKIIAPVPLPADKLPECWNQEERMKSLFAPFRNRSVNPEDWSSKYKFWSQLIRTWASYNAQCSITMRDLNANFKKNGVTALCLPTVFQELYKNGEVVLESDFLKESSSTWTGWTIDVFVKKPVTWSFSKLKSYVSEPVFDTDARYIHIAAVKELAELILSTIDSKKENTLLSSSELTKLCVQESGNDRITESNVKLALIYLRHTKKATFRDCKDSDKNELLAKISSTGAEQITEVDEGIHKLTQQESMLIKNIEQLEVERNEVISKAKSSLASGLKQVAKSHLRKKHEIEKCIEKRSAALQNVQRLMTRIHDARYDTDTLAAYKAGCNALKKFEDSGLNESHVQDTMDDMSDILAELNEVQSVMTQPVHVSESDSELEKELAEIMESAWDEPKEVDNKKPLSFNSFELPNLSELELHDLPEPKNKVPANTTQSQA